MYQASIVSHLLKERKCGVIVENTFLRTLTAVVQILLYPNLCCAGATDELRSSVLNKIKPHVLVDIVFQDNLTSN